jgi:hypothetical protein
MTLTLLNDASSRSDPGRLGLVLTLAAAALLAGCNDNLSKAAAGDAQVCYRFSDAASGKKVLVSAPDENLETCAMHLEGWRMMHGLPKVNGFYQSHYVFTSATDISSSAGPRDIRYRVYTPGQHADLDQKLQTLIDQDAQTNAGANTTANSTADAQQDQGAAQK